MHICITGPEGRALHPSCGKRTLHQFFVDLTPERIRATEAYLKDPEKGKQKVAECFNERQAREMVAYVRSTSPDETVVINCEAGISRSPGAVLAFRRSQGDPTDDIFEKAWPNEHVTKLVEQALNVRPTC